MMKSLLFLFVSVGLLCSNICFTNAQESIDDKVLINKYIQIGDHLCLEYQHKEAAKYYLKAAELGSPLGQYNLASLYEEGYLLEEGDDEDFHQEMAKRWYQLAFSGFLLSAKQGDVDAQSILGDMYSYGEGVDIDWNEAIIWYRKAAEKGDAYAQFAIGEMYQWGLGVAQNITEAIKWYRLSAAQGNESALRKLHSLENEL